VRYVVGIDGGQSSTTAVIVDQNGVVRGRGSAGPADHVDQPPGSRKCAEACTTAVMRALDAARMPPDSRFEAVHVGLSGYDEHFDGVVPAFAARSVRMQHDAPVALAGAVHARPAVVVIAGTGSVAYGEDGAGASVRAGGWGYLFGDEGSAFAVARDALAHAMREDDRGRRSALGDAALAYFDRRNLRELATDALLGRVTRRELASFARVVHNAARLDDPDAAAIVQEAVSSLARLAAVAIERLHLGERPVSVAFSGGAFGSETLLARARERLGTLAPNALVIPPRYDAAIGAALLAFADADLPLPDRIVEPEPAAERDAGR
jgi:N-acetylglucosamine kinase-like BadF-type ATPase